MKLSWQSYTAEKRYALTISSGTETASLNFWITIDNDGEEGWGEATEYDIPGHEADPALIERELANAVAVLAPLPTSDIEGAYRALRQKGFSTATLAGIDQALHDWAGRKAGKPVYEMIGADPANAAPTSVTVGINSPEGAVDRLRNWLGLGTIRALKVKLGSPAGIAADQRMFSALIPHFPEGVSVSVDANGGWSVEDAETMMDWLAERGVDHIEQPLYPGQHDLCRRLKDRKVLPIMADEDFRTVDDIAVLKDCYNGINIKMMKCGGLTPAVAIIKAARAAGMKIMLGCYGDGMLSNGAAAQLGGLVDYVDLDSHLNHRTTPFAGMGFDNGFLTLSGKPGLGVRHA
jgi:L-Ala-D/L-Glu epimerase